MSYAREQAHRVEAVTSDHLQACPRCSDLAPLNATHCMTCGELLGLSDRWLKDHPNQEA